LATGLSTVSLYFDQRPNWGSDLREEIQLHLRELTALGLRITPGKIAMTRLKRQDWAESWKRHFRPMEIGPALLIRPSWSGRRAVPGQFTVVLDPGLSFGTGQHPTTAFCLRQVVKYRPRASAKSFLDLGTGSGILAIAAARLGYEPIVALDFDPEAVRVARANAHRNRVAGRIRFSREDVGLLPRSSRRTFSLVCANLATDVLLKNRERIIAQLSVGGVLVLAGILKAEYAEVRRAYESAGLRELRSRIQKEWQSGAFAQS
jgi:ribosomal protein L11 methyltransferase